MNCPNCAAMLNPGTTICPNCGAQINNGGTPTNGIMQQQNLNQQAVAQVPVQNIPNEMNSGMPMNNQMNIQQPQPIQAQDINMNPGMPVQPPASPMMASDMFVSPEAQNNAVNQNPAQNMTNQMPMQPAPAPDMNLGMPVQPPASPMMASDMFVSPETQNNVGEQTPVQNIPNQMNSGMPMNNQMNVQQPIQAQDMNMNPGIQNQMPMNNQMNISNQNNDIQPMNQMQADTSQPQEPKKKEKKKVSPIIIILLIILLIVLAYAGYYWYGVFNEKKNNNSSDNQEKQPIVEEDISRATLGNYQFTVPEDYRYENENNKLIVSNSEYSIILVPINISFSDLKDHTDELKSVVEKNGITSEEANLNNINSKEYILFNGKYQNIDTQYFYTELDSNNSLQGLIFKSSSTEKYDNGYTAVNSLCSSVSVLSTDKVDFNIDLLGIDNINIDTIKNNINIEQKEETEQTEA